MTPTTKKLIDLLEKITIPLATREQSWEIATRIRATIAEVRAEEAVEFKIADLIRPIPTESPDPVYGAWGPFGICHGGIVDVNMRSLALWQKRILVDRANALVGVRNPAAVKKLIADVRWLTLHTTAWSESRALEWARNAAQELDKEPEKNDA